MSKLIHYSGPAGSILLPSGYTRLSYIQSTGSQWVDTRIVPTNTTRVFIDYQLTSTPDSSHLQRLFGARTATKDKACVIAFTDGGNNKTYIDMTGTYGTTDASTYLSRTGCGDLSRHTISITDTYIAIDYNKNTPTKSKMYSTYTASTFTSLYNAYLFAYNQAGSCMGNTYAKIYTARIWNNGQIVRDYVPVQTTSTVTSADSTSCPSGSIGLLDLVDNKFYQNKGTGTFIAGPECPQGFPTSEYCQVEWLGTDGTKSFNTGLTDDNANLEYEIDWTMDQIKNSKSFILGTAWETNGVKAGYLKYYYRDNNGNSLSSNITYTGNIDKLTYKSATYKVNGTTIATGSNAVTNKPLLLMGGSDNPAIGKMHRCQIWQGGTKMRDYIPCYRRSDMTPGFYDLVNRAFTVASSFLLGPSIIFGWGEVINDMGAEAHPMLGTQYTPSNKLTHTDSGKDANKTLPVYQRVEPGQQISISFDTDVTQWASRHDTSGGTTNKGKWSMWIYFSKIYDPSNTNYDSPVCYAASQIKSLGGTRWKYSFTVPTEMHMIRIRTNLYSDGSTSYTAHFWNFNWSFGDTGCRVDSLHALPHNISTGDGRNGEKNGSFQFNGSDSYMSLLNPGLESFFNNRTWTISFWMNPASLPADSQSANWKRLLSYRTKTTSDTATKQCVIYLTQTGLGISFFADNTQIAIPGLAANKWIHVAYTQNGATSTLYVNGVQVGTSSKGTCAIPTGSRLDIGMDSERGMGAFNGKIEGFQLYNECLGTTAIPSLM